MTIEGMKMKILMVSYYFEPENNPRAFRTTALLKKFLELGHQVTLVIPKKNIDIISSLEKYSNVKFVSYKTSFMLEDSGWKSVASKIIYKSAGNLLERYYFPHRMHRRAVFNALKPLNGFDVVLSIAHPHAVHWGVSMAMKANKLLAKKWIGDCGDPFLGNPFSANRHRSLTKYDSDFLSNCDVITVPFKGAIAAYDEIYHNKIKVVPQAFDIEEDRKLLPIYKKNQIPTFAYSGVFYPGYRDPTAFLKALCLLGRDYKFILYTSSGKMISEYVKKSRGRIIVMPIIPRAELLAKLGQMDFLVNIENIGTVQLPSKLIDYAIVDRPVLSIKPNEIDFGMLHDFLDGDYSGASKIDNLEDYNINKVADQFISLANDLA